MSVTRTAAFSMIEPFALYILFLVADRPLSEWLSPAGMDLRWLYAARAGLVGLVLVFSGVATTSSWRLQSFP